MDRLTTPHPRRLTALLVALAAILTLTLGAGANRAHAAAPAVTFGTGDWSFPGSSTLDSLGAQGLRTWRLTVSWADVQPSPSHADWSGYDNVLRQAAAANVEVMVVLTGCPAWECPNGGPPASGAALAGFQGFVRTAVARWGTGGSLWQTVKGPPVRYWQVLNEVNGSMQWAPYPSARGYAALLKPTAATIRSTDRNAKVVLAGLGEKMDVWLRDYLPGLYRQPGFKNDFDVVAPEGYAVRPIDVARVLDTTRRIMRRYKDTRKKMFITEMGWSVGGPAHPFTLPANGQATSLRKSWSMLSACRSRWNLRRVYWFSYQDHPVTSPSLDYWGLHNGLVDTNGSPKPAWSDFLKFVGKRGATGRCALGRL